MARCVRSEAPPGLDLVEKLYPNIEIQPKVRYLLEEMFPDDLE